MHQRINTDILRQELTKVINGSTKPLVDALKDLGVDVNQMKRDKLSTTDQTHAKQLLKKELT